MYDIFSDKINEKQKVKPVNKKCGDSAHGYIRTVDGPNLIHFLSY